MGCGLPGGGVSRVRAAQQHGSRGSPAAPRAGGGEAGAGLLKKSGGVLREGAALKYASIEAHRSEYPVVLMCRVLEVSRSGFYAAQRRLQSERRQVDARLRLQI